MAEASAGRARSRSVSLAEFALALLAVGATLGYGSPAVGVVMVVVALAASVLAIRRPSGGEVMTLLSIVLFTALLVLLAGLPTWCLAGAALAGAIYQFAAPTRWWWSGLLPAVALQVALLQQRWQWGRAAIDVFTTLQTATQHLLRGQDPYRFLYQDLAPLPTWHLVKAPFQYGPAALYLGTPGRVIGDVRLLAAVAAVLTVGALALIARRRGQAQLRRVAYLASSLPLWGPIVVNAWVDVYTAAGLAAWWFLRDRHWVAGSIALGVGAAAKPVLLVGLLPLLVWEARVRRETLVAAATAIVLCVPFLVWTGPVRFIYAVAGAHVAVLNAIWPTSVTFNALLLKAHLSTIPDVVSVVVLLASVPVAALWRPARLDARLLAAVAFMLAALLLSKQSFLNYYFVVAVWMLIAIAEQPEPVVA